MFGIFGMASPPIRLFRLIGFNVCIYPSTIWMAVILLFLISSHTASLLSALIVVLGLYLILILGHELGHAWLARKMGLYVDRIDLMFLGGLTNYAGQLQSGKMQALIALAGPAASALIWAVLILLASIMPPGVVSESFALLGTYSLILCIFNLVPAWPLDGGQALKAFLDDKVGPRRSMGITSTVGIISASLLTLFALSANWIFLFVFGLYFIWASYQLGQEAKAYPESFAQQVDDSPSFFSRSEKPNSAHQDNEPDLESIRKEMDVLLAKIKSQGLSSLSPKERARLEEISQSLNRS